MGERKPLWFLAVWRSVDSFLRSFFDGLKSLLRTLNVLRVMAFVGILVLLATAILVAVRPEWAPYVLAILLVLMAFPLVMVLALLSLPFRFRSFVRLVRKGYPDNVKEITIRVAARKMHEQSIETEELLVETAWNEWQKMTRRLRRDEDGPGGPKR